MPWSVSGGMPSRLNIAHQNRLKSYIANFSPNPQLKKLVIQLSKLSNTLVLNAFLAFRNLKEISIYFKDSKDFYSIEKEKFIPFFEKVEKIKI
jgi:hypothetical protein